jgi:hypothetical protein
MAARLKVFVTSDGLTDYVVATSSRPKALAAWGVRQDLFKEGQAHETDDPKLIAAATAQPGEVLRRPAGSRETLARAKPVKKPKPAGPSKAALRRVAALEAKLAALEAAHAAAEAKLDEARERLEAEADRRREKTAAERDRLRTSLRDAKRALEP